MPEITLELSDDTLAGLNKIADILEVDARRYAAGVIDKEVDDIADRL